MLVVTASPTAVKCLVAAAADEDVEVVKEVVRCKLISSCFGEAAVDCLRVLLRERLTITSIIIVTMTTVTRIVATVAAIRTTDRSERDEEEEEEREEEEASSSVSG